VIGVPPPPRTSASVDALEDAETVIARAPERPADHRDVDREGYSLRFGDGFAAAPDGLTGMVLAGSYRLVRVIGEGGMGRVYEALSLGADERCAVKVLADELCGQPRQVERFIREAQTAARIESEHVVTISDSGVTPTGAVYFAMEYLEGEDLSCTIHRDGALPWPRVRHIMLQLCAALTAAHARGVVHRDIKPHNCFRMQRGGDTDFIKVFDFGIAKLLGASEGDQLTRTGQIFGTPEYMSPEQIKGEPVDLRMDIYAAGIIFFELLTGRPPFESDDPLTVISRQLAEPPPELGALRRGLATPPGVAAIVMRALAKEVGARYQSAAELAHAITGIGGEVRFAKTQLAAAIPARAAVSTLGARPLALAVLIIAAAIMVVAATAWTLAKVGG
jgi:eukaryotic-like serine/threonine-protein kinase